MRIVALQKKKSPNECCVIVMCMRVEWPFVGVAVFLKGVECLGITPRVTRCTVFSAAAISRRASAQWQTILSRNSIGPFCSSHHYSGRIDMTSRVTPSPRRKEVDHTTPQHTPLLILRHVLSSASHLHHRTTCVQYSQIFPFYFLQLNSQTFLVSV